MKSLFISLLSFLLVHNCDGQILKKLGDKIKGDAEWRVRNKADNKVRKGIDTLFEAPKKIIDKKKAKKDAAQNTDAENINNNSASSKNKNQNSSGNIKASATDENDMTPKDGFIILKLSATKIFAGGTLFISVKV